MRAFLRVGGLGGARLLCVLLCAIALVAGCSRGPGVDALRDELRQGLDAQFEDGLFSIRQFVRRGSAPAGSEGLFVYYDAELEFMRDYALTAWRGLNLGTLAFVLGATESGIEGFKAKGNAKGETLIVRGRLLLEKDDTTDEWVRVVRGRAAEASVREPAVQDLRGSGPDALLQSVRDQVATAPAARVDARNTHDAVIVRELRGALTRIDLAVASLDGKATFGSGPRPGTYFTFGTMLSRFAAKTDTPVFAYESAGSVENGRRLQDRSLDFGLLQSDIAEMLYVGSAEERIFPNRDLRSVASLWPEAIHLVTLEGTGIDTVADLRGRRIAVGARGSGTRVNAVTIGLAAGFEAEEMPRIEELGLIAGIEALERGEVEALFVSEAIPSPALQVLAARRSDLHFLSLDPSFVEDQSEKELVYYPHTVAARTYPGQEEPFQTLAFACTLMTHRDVPDERIEGLLGLLVDRVDELAALYFRAAFVSEETMRLGIAVPLHPAAQRFYEARTVATE